MPAPFRNRAAPDVGAPSDTREELINAGERLYALRGIEGTNLLAIAREAGQANKSAVQYHFGDRNGLISAILDTRVAWLEARRAERLAEAGPDPDLRSLLEMVMLPIADLVDDKGRRTYARFLLQFMIQFEPWEGVHHPLRRPHPETTLDRIRQHLRARTPHLSRELLFRRLDWCLRTFLAALIDYDNAIARGASRLSLKVLTNEAVDMGVAYLLVLPRRSRD